MILQLTPPATGMSPRTTPRTTRRTPTAWQPFVVALCGLFALAGLLSPPAARATVLAGDGVPLLAPDPGMPDASVHGDVHAKKPRRTALPSLRCLDERAMPGARVAAMATPAVAPSPADTVTFVPARRADPPGRPLPRSRHSRAPPVAA